MNCAAFELWLNGGQLPEERSRALAHSRTCSRCDVALLADRELNDVLSRRFATAPDSFTDSVMAKLPPRPKTAPVMTPLSQEPVFPLWVRVIQEPLTLFSFLAGVILLGFGFSVLSEGSRWIGAQAPQIEGGWFSLVDQMVSSLPAFPQWLLTTGLLVPSVALAWFLYRTLTVRGDDLSLESR